jgi:hydroxymethylbilane synthase
MSMIIPHTIIIGSRGSELALWQAAWVRERLEKNFPELKFQLEVFKTKGDRIQETSLSAIGGKGLFTKEIDEALLDGRIDLSVHSLKDLPTEVPEGLLIGAVTERADLRDVFISHPRRNYAGLSAVPKGGRIATGSLRRKCQLLHYRPDIEIVDMRGNVPTRLHKLDASDWDGMILALAGLMRLNLMDRVTEIISTDVLLPAVGQGALAVEVRAGDAQTRQIVSSINDWAAALSTSAERTLLKKLEGGCQVPIGAYARVENELFQMEAFIGSLDGKTLIRGSIHGSATEAEMLAETLAETLLEGGGEKVLKEIRSTEMPEVPAV